MLFSLFNNSWIINPKFGYKLVDNWCHKYLKKHTNVLSALNTYVH